MHRTIGLEHVLRPRPVAVAGRKRAAPAGADTTDQAVLEMPGPGIHCLEDVQRQVDALLERGPSILVVDLSQATHTSSSAIAALMCVRRRASARGVEVALRAADPRLVDTLQRSGLLDDSSTRPPENRTAPDDSDPGPQAGVTRLDLLCGPQVTDTAHELTRRWAQDRALSAEARARLVSLVVAAFTHGLRFDPRSVTITIAWLDLDRVRVDVKWKGCKGKARAGAPAGDLESTVGTLDAFAEEWGFATHAWGPVQWMVVDTRHPHPSGQPTSCG
jgi:anti-anti-sigma regulatory factor